MKKNVIIDIFVELWCNAEKSNILYSNIYNQHMKSYKMPLII